VRTSGVAFSGLLILFASATAMELNGFMPGDGQADLAISYSRDTYDHFWMGHNKVADPEVGKVTNTSLSMWGQWGISDRLAVLANLPYVTADSDGFGGFAKNGLQDLTVVGKYQLAATETGQGQHLFFAAAGFRTPASGYEANSPVDIGDGTTDALLRLVYQFEQGPMYLAQQVGFDLRGGDAPNGLPLHTEVGATVRQFTGSFFYSQYLATGGTDLMAPDSTYPSNKDEYKRLGAKIYGKISGHLGTFVGVFTTLGGRNSGDTTGLFAGLAWSVSTRQGEDCINRVADALGARVNGDAGQ
jgi:hypothetical protein